MSLEEFLDRLEKDGKAKRRLAEMIVSDYDVRIALINAVLRDVATRQDILELRNEISSVQNELKSYVNQRIEEVNNRIEDLSVNMNKRIDDVNKRIDDVNSRIIDLNSLVRASLIAIVVTLATTILVPLLLKFFA